MIEALPWSDSGLAEYKMRAIHEVMERFSPQGGADLEQYGGTYSEPVWTASEERRSQMIKDIIVWRPAEGTLPDHRAEARRLVYEGLLAAGCVPRGARRRERSRMRIA